MEDDLGTNLGEFRMDTLLQLSDCHLIGMLGWEFQLDGRLARSLHGDTDHDEVMKRGDEEDGS